MSRATATAARAAALATCVGVSYFTARAFYFLAFQRGFWQQPQPLELAAIPFGQFLVLSAVRFSIPTAARPLRSSSWTTRLVGRPRATAAALGALCLIVYNANARLVSAPDAIPARLLPLSLLGTGRLDLDPFAAFLRRYENLAAVYTTSPQGHLVSRYPVVVPLAVAPLFVPATRAWLARGRDLDAVLPLLDASEKLAASLLAALSVAAMFFLLRRHAAPSTCLLLTLVYAFATQTWIIGSQALYQHGLSELLLAALLLCLPQATRRAACGAGVCAGLLVATRPTNVFFALPALLFAAVHQPRRLPYFAAPALAIAALLGGYNVHIFGAPLGGYQSFATHEYGAAQPTHSTLAGTVGLLLSTRGLLWFAPFFLFLARLPSAPLRQPTAALLWFFLPAAALQVVFYGGYFGWFGGDTYGPRFLTDMTPLLVLALAPVVDDLRGAGRVAFAALALFAVEVQAIGAFCFPKGRSYAHHDFWNPARLQFIEELHGRPASPDLPRRLLALDVDRPAR